jgi:hypothetical protein
MLSPRRGVGGQAGRLSVVRNFLTYLRAFIAETEVPHHGLLSGPNRRKASLPVPGTRVPVFVSPGNPEILIKRS